MRKPSSIVTLLPADGWKSSPATPACMRCCFTAWHTLAGRLGFIGWAASFRMCHGFSPALKSIRRPSLASACFSTMPWAWWWVKPLKLATAARSTLGGTSLYKGTKRHPTLGKNVVVGAGAKVLGGFTVGDGAKVGSNAVVTKPVPAGATAVGNPARIIEAQSDAVREEVASKMGFSAYGVTQNDDPLSQAMRGLIDHAAEQDKQMAMLWQALEKMATGTASLDDCKPNLTAKSAHLEIEKLNKLID
jgi:hypothetical protein